MAKRRHRNSSLGSEQSGSLGEIKDDLNQAAIHKAYVATIAIDVRTLDTTTHKNREIDWEHAAQLIESFKRGVRRFLKETRMRASMSGDDYETMLQEYAINDADDESSVAKARIRATNTDEESLEDFVHLDKWPDSLKSPALIAGHHRRVSLIEILKEQKRLAVEGGKKPDGEALLSPDAKVIITPQRGYYLVSS